MTTATKKALWAPSVKEIQNRSGALTIDGIEHLRDGKLRLQIEDITPDPAKAITLEKTQVQELVAELQNWLNQVEFNDRLEEKWERRSRRGDCPEW